MKRIISLILSICIISASTVFAVAENNTQSGTAVETAIEVLKALDFVNDDYDLEDMDIDAKVTRADFAYLAGTVFNFTKSEPKELYFYDVSKDYYAFKEISYLAEIGAISGKENKMFYPEDTITMHEAASIVIRGLGYGRLLELYGTWPSNVTTMINQLDLCKSIQSSGDMTFGNMFVMLYNALDVEILELSGDSYKGSDETYLSAKYNIYHEKGILKGFDDANYGTVSANIGEAVINETVFDANGLDLNMLIGCNVEYFYYYDGNDTYKLIWVKDTSRSSVLELSFIDDDVDFNKSNYEMTYYEGNRQKKAKIARGLELIYNGRRLGSNVDDVLASSFDTLRLIDEDGNGIYEIAVVYVYENYVVGNNDTANEIFYDANENKSFDYGDYDRIDVYQAGGNKGDVNDIISGAVASVYAAKDKSRATVYLSLTTAEGNVSKVTERNGYTEFTIDGKVYTAIDDVSDKYKTTGQTVMLYLDYKGNIAYVKSVSGGMKFGYILNTYFENGQSSSFWTKIFTEDGDMQEYRSYKKLKIDGTTYKNAQSAYEALGGDDLTPQIIRYELNSDGFISEIDTVRINGNSTDSITLTNTKGYRIYKGGKLISNADSTVRGILMNASTKIFCVPTDTENAKDEDYIVKTKSNFKDWQSTTSESYSVDTDSFFEDVVVLYDSSWGSTNISETYIMVNDFYTTLNDEDEQITEIEGVAAGKELVVDCAVDCEVPELKRGDLLYLTYNNKGEVSNIVVRYSPGGELPAFVYDHSNNYVCTIGYAYDAASNAVKIKKSGSTENYDDIYSVSSAWVYYSGDDYIEKGTPANIVTEKQSGRGSVVVITTSQGYVSSCFVYN